MKKLVNASSTQANLAYDIFIKEIPSLKNTTVDRSSINTTIKGLIMKIIPWEKDYKKRIKILLAENYSQILIIILV